MKNLLLILTIIINVIHSYAQTLEKHDYSSSINSITVFLDGAEVSRTKDIALKKGINKIEFKGLSPFIKENSIRVQADDKYNLLSISHQEDYLFNKKYKPELKLVEDSISEITLAIVKIENQLKAFKSEEEMLSKNHKVTDGLSVENLAKAAMFFRKRYNEINNKVSKLESEKAELKSVLNRLNSQFNSLESKGHYNRGKVEIILKSDKAEITNVGIKYLVTNAGWAALYDIKSNNIKKPIDLIYRAKVFNETEISWENVPLKLSTADPSRNITKPTLKKWELSYKRNKKFQLNSQKALAFNSKTKNETVDKKQSDNVQMMIPVDELNSEFDISGMHNIPSSSNPYFVKIGTYTLPATYKHYCAPKVENSAFLIAEVTGWQNINLIMGKSNIYFNGTYIGNSIINPAEVSDTMDISLGRDKKIVIQKVKKKEFSSNQLIGGNKKEIYAYETVVKNNRSEIIDIEVLDHIPVSLDSEIVVEKIESKGAKYNELEGTLEWNLKVNAGSSQVTSFSFSVKYPKNKPIKTNRHLMRSIRYF